MTMKPPRDRNELLISIKFSPQNKKWTDHVYDIEAAGFGSSSCVSRPQELETTVVNFVRSQVRSWMKTHETTIKELEGKTP